jgi:tetratricopeptide (TPR) repeat protein
VSYAQVPTDDLKTATRAYKRGEYDNAIKLANKILDADAKNIDALNLRAIARYKAKDFDGAISDYTAIIAIDEKSSKAYGGRGVVFYEKGDLKKAEEDYTKAAEIDKEQQLANPAIFFQRALVFQREGKIDESINDLTIVTKIVPNDPKAYLERALLYFFKNKYALALADWQKGAELNSKSAEAMAGQAIASYRVGQEDDAKTALRAALILEPRFGDVAWVGATRDNGPGWHGRATEALGDLLPKVK